MVKLTVKLAKTSWASNAFGFDNVETRTIELFDQALEFKLAEGYRVIDAKVTSDKAGFGSGFGYGFGNTTSNNY